MVISVIFYRKLLNYQKVQYLMRMPVPATTRQLKTCLIDTYKY